MSGWYELKKAENGQYSFSLRDANGDVLLRSEQYKARDSATSGIASMQKNSVQDQRFIRLNAADGRSYFNLRAGNHQVIGTSPMYATAELRDAAIAATKAAGVSTEIRSAS